MDGAIALLNFGEPAEPSRDAVVSYLARIFRNNADLEDADTEAEVRERSRELAERRAPGLIEEYEAIGGSPLNEQAEAQADALAAELAGRGYDVATHTGMQFTEPFVSDAADAARADGVDHLIGLPIYPLCGPSTTVDSLDALDDAVAAQDDWDPTVDSVTGWHRHPTYTRLRADAIRDVVAAADLDLTDPDTRLVFSAHGTPRHYLEEGSRYDQYVSEFTETVAAMLGVEEYDVGFQNHENRGIPWTEPEVEDVIASVDAERVVVDPVSFMHEQSETLSELDDELAAEAADRGLEFHRVPIPHDDDRFPGVLADLVEPFLAGFDPDYSQLRACECRGGNSMCLNAPRSR